MKEVARSQKGRRRTSRGIVIGPAQRLCSGSKVLLRGELLFTTEVSIQLRQATHVGRSGYFGHLDGEERGTSTWNCQIVERSQFINHWSGRL